MATQPTTVLGSFRFGDDFELDVRAFELRSAGIPLKLKPIPLELLLFLIERRGELVTREQIVERIWGAGVFLDTDNSINGAISKIRQVLRDDAAQPRFVQTVTGRGYRFIAPVTQSLPSSPRATPSAPADLLIGKKVTHYRLLELLGGGGMGVVYKAEDLKLGRRVAIKFLPDELASDPKALSRLESEARAASALDHRNICAIYELDEHDGQPFIVMQLLEGQTLQEQMEAAAQRRTTLPIAKVLAIAIQVADGLHAAHKAGFIHRDIKPANIFISANDEVKILDFGLAQSLKECAEDSRESVRPEPSSSPQAPSSPRRLRLTMTGTHVGTAFYMSPEQVRGEKLDARTDIFSFGLVLYQMLSGQRAFPGSTTHIVHDGILNNTPVPLREVNPKLPSKLLAVVERCLEKDRAKRFQSISEVSAILSDVAGGTEPQGFYVYRHKWQFAALIVLVIGCAVLVFRAKHTTRRLSQTDILVISDFTNTTGDTVFDGTLRQATSLQLRQTPSLHVLEDKQVIDTLKMMTRPAGEFLSEEAAREVCLRANSRGVVSGSIAPMGNGYELRIRVSDCQTGDILSSATTTARDKNQVLRALGDAVTGLRGQLGESLTSLQKFNKPLDEATTSSLEALQAYSEGRYQEFHKGYESAVPYYNLAIELDPGFALAYGALAQSYYNLDDRDLADRTCAKAFELRSRASRREQLRIEALYYWFDIGDLDRALVALTEWAADFPSDYEPLRILNSLYRSLGHYDEALRESQRYVALAPNNSSAYFGLTMAYVRLNDADRAVAAYRLARSKNLDSEVLRFAGYLALFLKGDKAGLEREVEAANGNRNAESWIVFASASTQAYAGREQLSIANFQQAMKLAESAGGSERAGMWQAEVAMNEAEVGRPGPALRMAKESLALSNGLDVQAKSAFALALAGDTSQASAIANHLKQQSPHNTLLQQYTVPLILGAVAMRERKSDRAVATLLPPLVYELGGDSICCLWSAYIRGKAYLEGKHAKEAAREFQKLIDHPGTVNLAIAGSLVYLQLARAQVMMGERDAAGASYQKFLTLWKDADPDLPIYQQAKAEYARLQ